ncbi:MAG: helix-turn-helix domain-containing protein [Halobacteriaceae archaeon]
MDDDRPIEDILDTIGDSEARRILAALSNDSQSAKALADELELSRPTVYRRLETLQEHDLVVHQTRVADDGNHYKVWECNFNSTVISLDDDEYNVRIYREENLPDRFSQLWNDLSAE